MKIVTDYISKIIIAMFCSFVLVYSQHGYADFEKKLVRDEISGKEYPFMCANEMVVTQEIAQKITDTLAYKKNRKPWWLMFQKVSFEPQILPSIVRALQADQTLEKISLLSNIYAEADYQAIIEILRTVKTIKNFVIIDKLNEAFETEIIEALIAGNLTGIELFDAIGDRGAATLSQLLRNNKTLLKFAIYSDSLTGTGIKAIADGLSENTGLIELVLSSDNLDDKAAIAIANALSKNCTLQAFKCLYGIQLTDKGQLAIIEALCCNSTIQKIEIYSDPNYVIVHDRIMKRNKLVNQVLAKTKGLSQKIKIAVLSSTHSRLGKDSPMSVLDVNSLQEILNSCYLENPLEILTNLSESQLAEFTSEEQTCIVKIKALQNEIVQRINQLKGDLKI